MRAPARSEIVGIGAVIAVGVVMGAAIVVTPLAAGAAIIFGGASVIAARSSWALQRAMTGVLLGGAMILGYGFANLGIRTGGVPIPFAEMLLLPLLFVAMRDPRTSLAGRAAIPIWLFAGVMGFRLLIDYPNYETDAIRDATLGVEVLAVFVGAHAIARDGFRSWVRWLTPVMFIVVLYGTMFPIRNTLESFSPTVGLQRSVPLIGSFPGVAFAVVAAGLFFAVFTHGWKRLAMFGWALGVAVMHQQRSLYLLIPAAILVLGWSIRRPVRLIALTATALVIGAMTLSWVLPGTVEGRLGPTTPGFFVEHAKTLLGESGPGAGSIDDRARWATRTLDEWTATPASTVVGVGLGPDLTFGFRQDGDIAVRKPHNDFLEVLARTGAIGFLVFMWMIVSLMRPILRRARGGGDAGRFCGWVGATAVVYFGVAAVQPLLAFPYGTIPLFVLLGMGSAVARRGADNEPEPRGAAWAR